MGFSGAPSLLNTPSWLPSDVGKVAWTYDPAMAQGSSLRIAGQMDLYRIVVRSYAIVTNVEIIIGTAGATLTAGQNFSGLYNFNGVLIASTADQSGNWTSPGNIVMPLVGGPYAIPAGSYWVAFLSNGTTIPTLLSATNTFRASDLGTPNPVTRFGFNGTGLTSLPPSFSPATNTGGSPSPWAALS